MVFAAGSVMTMAGGTESTLIQTSSLPVLLASSWAVAVIWVRPSTTGTTAENVAASDGPLTGAGSWLTSTLTADASLTVPCTPTVGPFT